MVDGGRPFVLTYRGVQAYRVDVPGTGGGFTSAIKWGYDELERLQDGLWEHRILCGFDCAIALRFAGIGLKRMARAQ